MDTATSFKIIRLTILQDFSEVMKTQSTPSWRTAHHSGSGGEKSEEECQLRALNNFTRGTHSLPVRTVAVFANLKSDCLATANAAPNQQQQQPLQRTKFMDLVRQIPTTTMNLI